MNDENEFVSEGWVLGRVSVLISEKKGHQGLLYYIKMSLDQPD